MNIVTIVLSIIIIAASIGFGVGKWVHWMKEMEYCSKEEEKPFNRKCLIPNFFLILIGIGFFVLGMSFVIIPTGSTGVLSTFGLIQEKPLNQGFNWKRPFVDSVEIVNNKQQDRTMDGQVWSETAEQTAVYMENVTVTYYIDPSMSAWIYANVTNYDKNLLTDDMISSALKTASRTITTANVTNRGIIEPAAKETLQEVCDEKYGDNTIHIINVVINSMDFEDSYNAAIAQRQEAMIKQEQQAVENKTNVDRATAEAEAARIRAQGEADALLIEADAKAEYNKIISQSITEATQRQDAIDRWNGELPKYIGGSDGDVTFGIMESIGNE